MTEIDKLLGFVPERYRSLTALLIMLSPYISRSIYSLMNGGGLRGIFRAIWLGTNTPPGIATKTEVAHAIHTGDTQHLTKTETETKP